MKHIICEKPPYKGCKVYKTFHKEEKRYYACIIFPDKSRTTISYARYLVSINKGRLLTKEETVDHIDGNKTNDNLCNLQIMSRSANLKKHYSKVGLSFVSIECPECGKIFDKEKRQTRLIKQSSYTACSRSCSGKIGKKLQMGISVNIKPIIKEFRKYS